MKLFRLTSIYAGILFFLIAGNTAQSQSKPDFILENDNISLGFDTNRLALVSLRDPNTNHEFLESLPKSPILWVLDLEKSDGTPFQIRSTAESKRRFRRSSDGRSITMIWKDLDIAQEKTAMEVRVHVDLPEGSDRSYWRIEVDNNSSCSLMTVQFPHISGISRPGQPSAAIPRHNWGNLEKDIIYTRGSYPSDIWPMQFLAMLEKDSGLYLAYEDPRSTFKFFDLKAGDSFFFTSFVENATLPGNDFVSPGPVAIGVCGPDWWKGAKMYRQWATQQKWTSRGPLTQSSNVPEAAKRIGIWFNENLAPNGVEAQIAQIEEAEKFFGIPMAVQFYNWHRANFDTEYPEYFPPRPGFHEIIQFLTSRGAITTPYVNGRLQDMNVSSTEAAKPWMVKKRDGKPPIEDYGSGATLAVMCPATEYWQTIMFQTAAQLVKEGSNGIYYDQIGAAEPHMCYDPTHGHHLGGGSHWVDGYRKMLERVKSLRTTDGAPIFIATENNAECYMDTVDGFLTWTPRHPTEIPLLTAVYSGYTIYFASNAQVEENSGLGPFAMIVGRDMIWGTQPGWMGIDTTSERGTYLRDVSRVRHAGNKFFQFGELVGEIKPTNDPGQVSGKWKNINRDGAPPSEVTLPAVMSTVWKSPEGTLGIALANLSGEERAFHFTFDPTQYGVYLPESTEWNLKKISPNGHEFLGVEKTEKFSRQEKLKPWELQLIEVAVAEK